MKEHMLQMLPQNISKHIEERRARSKKSLLDVAALPVQSVKIVPAVSADEEEDVKTQADEEEIDQESLDRAKQIVCGGETWADKSERMLATLRENGIIDGTGNELLEMQCVLTKSNDDLRQEVFVMQMIHYYRSVFVKEGLPIWLHTYRILSTSKSTGLIEYINNATSIDGLKKSDDFPAKGGLRQYFIKVYGEPTSSSFIAATFSF